MKHQTNKAHNRAGRYKKVRDLAASCVVRGRHLPLLISCIVLVSVSALSNVAVAAQPYIFEPPRDGQPECAHPFKALKIPEDATARAYPSDECGTVYIGPAAEIDPKVSGQFGNVTEAQCNAMQALMDASESIAAMRLEYIADLKAHKLTPAQVVQRTEEIRLAQRALDDGLADDYRTYGARITITIAELWAKEVEKYRIANPDYNLIALPSVAGLITFEEKIIPEQAEIFGVYDTALKAPYISYTVTGINPINVNASLMDPNKVPIYFPGVTADRANLKSISFGGGAVTSQVTLNKVGYCQYKSSNQSPIVFLAPTISYNVALKTFGTYTVNVSLKYAMDTVDRIAGETNGTYFASALADDMYNDQAENTITVRMSNDLRNSLTEEQQIGLVQSAIYDAATQFLTAITGTAGEKKQIPLPDVAEVEQYAVVQKMRRVCNRSSSWFGLNQSKRCYDQAYNVKELQDTMKLQQAKASVQGAFNGQHLTRTDSYIVTPWNAGLKPLP